MPLSYIQDSGDGVTKSFSFSFAGQDEGYIRDSDIVALVDGVDTPFTLTSSNTLEFSTAPANGAVIRIRRVMPKELPYSDFSRGNNFGPDVLNNSFLQSLYTIHEALDGWFPAGFQFLTTVGFADNVNFNGFNIDNAGTLTADDIVIGPTSLSAEAILTESYNWAQYPLDQLVPEGNGVDEYSSYHYSVKSEGSADAAAISETNAAASESAAAISETNAATSEANALASKNAAAVSESNAATSEANALSSKNAAATSETNAATSASNALASENAAATSETNAASSEAAAATSESNAATSEANALASENKAEQWAEEAEDVPVDTGKFSAKHWSNKAEGWAQSLNLPTSSGEGGKLLRQSLNETGLEYVNPTARPNEFIDGQFALWIEGDTHTRNDGVYGSATMWKLNSTEGTMSMARQSFADGQTEVPYYPYNYCRVTTPVLADGTTGFSIMSQFIEDITKFAGKTVTLSFWAKADAAKQLAFEAEFIYGQDNRADSGQGTAAFNLTTSWQKFTHTFTFNELNLGAYTGGNDNETGFNFWVAAGTSYASRASGLANQAGTFDFANIKLEFGDTVTDGDWASPVEELERSYRYFLINPSNGANNSHWLGWTLTNGKAVVNVEFPVRMRTIPTMTVGDSGSGFSVFNGNVSVVDNGGVFSTLAFGSVFTEFLSERGFSIRKNDTGGTYYAAVFRWKADCRL